MSELGRPKAIDDEKQATLCSLIAAGVSLRQAAHFVGCDPKTVRREALRNDDFSRQLAQAKSGAKTHPLVTLGTAARSDWRAALCVMERLEPERFARPNAKIITQREANQFVSDLVASIERVVSNPLERQDLFELLAVAMPAAMRRRWDGGEKRRTMEQAMRDFDKKKEEDVELRCKRRREFSNRIARHLPWDLLGELGHYGDVLDPEIIRADREHAAARETRAGASPHDDAATNDGPTDMGSTNEDRANSRPSSGDLADGAPTDGGPANFASPMEGFVPPPRLNPESFASPPSPNPPPAHDLQLPREAKPPE